MADNKIRQKNSEKKRLKAEEKKTESPANNIVLGIEPGRKGFPHLFRGS